MVLHNLRRADHACWGGRWVLTPKPACQRAPNARRPPAACGFARARDALRGGSAGRKATRRSVCARRGGATDAVGGGRRSRALTGRCRRRGRRPPRPRPRSPWGLQASAQPRRMGERRAKGGGDERRRQRVQVLCCSPLTAAPGRFAARALDQPRSARSTTRQRRSASCGPWPGPASPRRTTPRAHLRQGALNKSGIGHVLCSRPPVAPFGDPGGANTQRGARGGRAEACIERGRRAVTAPAALPSAGRRKSHRRQQPRAMPPAAEPWRTAARTPGRRECKHRGCKPIFPEAGPNRAKLGRVRANIARIDPQLGPHAESRPNSVQIRPKFGSDWPPVANLD